MGDFVFSFSPSSFFSESCQWVWNITLWEEGREEGWVRLISGEPRSPDRQAKHSEKVGLPKLETAWGAGAFPVTTFWPWNHPVTPLSLFPFFPLPPQPGSLEGEEERFATNARAGVMVPCLALLPAPAPACVCLFCLFLLPFFFFLNEIWTFLCPAFLSCLSSWLVVSDEPHHVCASPHVPACLLLLPLSSETPSGTLESLHGKSFSFFSSVQPFQGLRQSCVKKSLTSTTGKTRNRKPQQDLANRSENKTDTAKALVSLHIRSSFNEENITGLSATHWL